MKRKSPKKISSKLSKAKPKKRPKVPPKRLVSGVKKQASRVLTHAQKLYARADEVHTKADELHKSIDDMHHAVQRRQVSVPGHIAVSEIIADEQEPVEARPFPIVGIGASAGGFEAFAELLGHLPGDPGMAIVFVQHLDPKHKSKLPELLGHNTNISVLEARNDMVVKPNNVYVMPENVTITLQNGRLRLAQRQSKDSPPMPVDVFFRSLARNQQNKAIAIVLSGTGTDGSLGVEAIKGEGGITFAQDQASAKYFGMPGSAIASGSVDFIMSPSAIAQELLRIASHPFVSKRPLPGSKSAKGEGPGADSLIQENSPEVNTIFTLLRQRKGVDFSLYKQTTIKRRIMRRMVVHKIDSLKDYLKFIQKSPAEAHSLFNDLLINVTNFFRDPWSFQALKKKVFPRILKAHTDDLPLRFWICGCATGEEAYSLAMSLVEFFEESGTHRNVQIFATDISEASIQKGRAGVYPENILQDVSMDRVRRFFTKVNGNYQVHKSIRDMCIFARQNVLIDPPFSNLDLVLCRNVLIYFGPLLQRRIIPLFHYALRQTGFLLLGNSETIGPAAEHFNLLDKKHKIYIKKETYNRPGLHVMQKPHAAETEPARIAAEKPLMADKPHDFQAQVDKILLREFSPPSVIINSDFEVLHFRGQTGDFLEHAPGSASLNLLKMARESVALPLRLIVTKALKKGSPVKQSGIELRHDGRHHFITIEARPFKLAAGDRYLIVVFRHMEGPGTDVDRLKGNGQKHLRNRGQLNRLEQERRSTKESLQTIIEEQEGTNEELKSANEEIQSSNEELQSTNEELETAKEELQSTNEELTTLNEELQNRNTSLSQVNNDLSNLLVSVNLPILMVDTELKIRRFTPVAEKVFNLIPSDAGRPLVDIHRNIISFDLESLVSRVIAELSILEREVQDRDGHWWMLRIRPYRTRENKIEGAVIVLNDIDELRRALDITLGMVKQPLLILGGDMIVRNVNKAFLETFGLSQNEIEAKCLFDVNGRLFDIPNLRLMLEDILPKNKRVIDYEIEITLPRTGRRKIKLNASRFFEERASLQIILVAAEDVTGS